MVRLVGGMATSHAFALVAPDIWSRGIEGNRKLYARARNSAEPALHPRAGEETLEANRARFARVNTSHERLARWLQDNADVLILIGDDQDEQFGPENLPAIALYDGDAFGCRDLFDPDAGVTRYRCASALASHLATQVTEAGFDISLMHRLRDDEIKAHAFGPVLRKLDPAARLSVVPVFVNGIHYPAPNPRRCYALGKALRQALEAWGGAERVAVCASGGMSHFSAAFPYEAAEALGLPPRTYGHICEQFDRQVLDWLEQGEGARLAGLSNRDLLEYGDVELRGWIVALGLLGDGVRAEVMAYEPFYSCITGVGVVHWSGIAGGS